MRGLVPKEDQFSLPRQSLIAYGSSSSSRPVRFSPILIGMSTGVIVQVLFLMTILSFLREHSPKADLLVLWILQSSCPIQPWSLGLDHSCISEGQAPHEQLFSAF